MTRPRLGLRPNSAQLTLLATSRPLPLNGAKAYPDAQTKGLKVR